MDAWRLRPNTTHPRPTTPYPFGQIKHLAYKVECNPRGLAYNYQAVGKHPAAGFSSPSSKTAHPLTRGVRLPLHVYISMGGPWWGAARLAGLFSTRSANLLRARSPTTQASVGRSRKYQGDRTMSKSTKNQPASRPPVDALQYEKLALSAFHLSDRHLDQLDTLITLASSICRNPSMSRHTERSRQAGEW
jgi:hypothetical protein